MSTHMPGFQSFYRILHNFVFKNSDQQHKGEVFMACDKKFSFIVKSFMPRILIKNLFWIVYL